MLVNGCDIVIATPGRIIDYLKQHVVSFKSVEAVVIDEADRMFDLGFIKDIRFLLRRMPPPSERQGMLYSATLSYRVLELAFEHMNSPEKVSAETESVTASRVRQVVYFPATEEKMPLLLNLLAKLDEQRSIIFINTKAMAERVTRGLERHGYRVATLSGDVPQAKRERLLGKFQAGDIEILVATDVAARGLHIPAVSHVFNFDLPQDAEDYVHRIGRTARLGAEGDAISFACDLYAQGLPDIETYIEQKIPTAPVTPELLLPTPPRKRADGFVADVDDEADNARNTAGAPPKETGRKGTSRSGPPSRSSGPRSGSPSRSESAERTRTPRPPRAPKPADEAATTAAETPIAAVANDAAPVNPVSTADGAPAKKRRRRGGRGGAAKRAAEANGDGAATTTGATDTSEPRRNERKPRRERSHGEDTRPAKRSTSTDASTAPPPKKQGFFNRLAKIFSRH